MIKINLTKTQQKCLIMMCESELEGSVGIKAERFFKKLIKSLKEAIK